MLKNKAQAFILSFVFFGKSAQDYTEFSCCAITPLRYHEGQSRIFSVSLR